MSGGKDSLALKVRCYHLQRFYPQEKVKSVKRRPVQLLVDLDQEGTGTVRELCREFGVPYTVIPTEIGRFYLISAKSPIPGPSAPRCKGALE